jgi:CxxC motif-containing protein (DUF1111 family)
MKSITSSRFALFVSLALSTAVSMVAQPPRVGPPAPPPPPPPPVAPPVVAPPAPAQLSNALSGLTTDQLADYVEGKAEFTNVETPATGLGPIFNDVSCVACHRAGGTGGAGRRTVTRFGHTTNGVFDPLTALGGSLLQERSINPAIREVVPPEANTIAHRLTTPLYGDGLIEAIPDSAIVLGTLRPKPPGIAGRVSVVADVVSGQNRIGRFGWKAQQATLLAFAGDAYLNEMGITNRFFPTENAPNGNTALLARFDHVADIEDPIDPTDGKADIDRLADFMRLLAPPPRSAENPSAQAGERLFATLACAACHTPSMTTGPSPIAALNQKPVGLFSDLLLHDMGALGDGIAQGTAGTHEMRTAPLWGLRARPLWLHDGRATTIDAAIRAHDGEAANSRTSYTNLNGTERQQLLDFLNTL